MNPWENSVQGLAQAMTGPIARGLSLVAIVIGGLMIGFGEGSVGLFNGVPPRKMMGLVVVGLGMALGAASFASWLFGA